MTTTPANPALHHQIADQLRESIRDQTLPPGASLPTLRELALTWHCSEPIVRRAIQVLQNEGLLDTQRGRRPTVRVQPPKMPVQLTTDWTQQQKDLVLQPRDVRMRTGALELTSDASLDDVHLDTNYAQVPATTEVAAALHLEDSTPVLRRTFVMTHKNGPLMLWTESFIPLAIASRNPDLLDPSNEPWPGGHQHQLYTVGVELGAFERTVSAAPATTPEQHTWGLAAGVPLLEIRSTSISTDGDPVEYSLARYPADRTHAVMRETLKSWPANTPPYDRGSDV